MKTRHTFSDYLGISSAVLCLLHCLATPLLIWMGVAVHAHSHGPTAQYMGFRHEHNASWDFLLHHNWDFVFLLIGLVAVWLSARHTPMRWMKGLLWSAYIFLAAAILLESTSALFQYLAYGASFALIMAHLMNLKSLLNPRAAMAMDCEC